MGYCYLALPQPPHLPVKCPLSSSLRVFLSGWGRPDGRWRTLPVASMVQILSSSAIELCDHNLCGWDPVRPLAVLTLPFLPFPNLEVPQLPALGLLPASGQPCPLICFF